MWTDIYNDNEELRGKCGVYIIRNKINNKKYIGSSKNILKRIREHRLGLEKGDGINEHFQNAYNKYGEENFECNVLEFCSDEEKYDKEQYYLTKLNPEYNISPFVMANTGHERPEEAKKKCSKTQREMVKNNQILSKKAYIYNVKTLKLSASCESIKDARKLLDITSGSNIEKRLYKDTYIISLTKFNTINDLINRINEYTKISRQRREYSIVEECGELVYYKTTKEIRDTYRITNFYQRHEEATAEKPLIIDSNHKFFYSKEYIPIYKEEYNKEIEYVKEFDEDKIYSGNVV